MLTTLVILCQFSVENYEMYKDRKKSYDSCFSYHGTCIIFLSQCRQVMESSPLKWIILYNIDYMRGFDWEDWRELTRNQYALIIILVMGFLDVVNHIKQKLDQKWEIERDAQLHKLYGGGAGGGKRQRPQKQNLFLKHS